VVEQTKKREVAVSLARALRIAGNNILTSTDDEEEIQWKKRRKKVHRGMLSLLLDDVKGDINKERASLEE
jgi:hypothetical protein